MNDNVQPTWPTTAGATIDDDSTAGVNGVTYTCIKRIIAWGDGDDAYLYVRSFNNTSAGSIENVAPSSGTDLNT